MKKHFRVVFVEDGDNTYFITQKRWMLLFWTPFNVTYPIPYSTRCDPTKYDTADDAVEAIFEEVAIRERASYYNEVVVESFTYPSKGENNG